MFVIRPPIASLRPFVAQLWATADRKATPGAAACAEHMLPTGMMHLVLRMTDVPLRVRESADDEGTLLRGAVVGGARSRYVIRELSAPACSVAAVLRPGAAQLLFGGGADELAGRHTPLADLWGAAAAQLRERLQDTRGAAARLAVLEAALVARLPRLRALHPGVAAQLGRLDAGCTVAAAVEASGLSHRHFVARFRDAVGLAPKTYLRVRRFQRAVQGLREGVPLADIAVEVGYSDQAHFSRDFVAFSGVTPTTYRDRKPEHANHLPIAGPGQIPSRLTLAGRR